MNLKKIGIVLFILVSFTTVRAAGEIDPTFNVAAYQLPGYSSIPPMKAQPDGKLLIAPFEYGVNNGTAFQSISRLNADGTVDASFNPPRLSFGTIATFGLQSNGKILLVGNFTIENSPYNDYARLNPDGSLDTTFNVIATPLPHEGFQIFVQPDDSFFTGSLYHFDANGIPDNTFQYGPYFAYVSNIAGLPDGKVYAGFEVPMSSGFDFLTRHNADGTRDSNYNGVQPNDNIEDMVVLPDGKLLIVGRFTFVNATQITGIARLNTDGSVDSSFNAGGLGPNSGVSAIERLPDGKILITGSFDSYNGVTRHRVARLNSDGTLDTSFEYTGTFTNVFPGDLQVLSNGKIIVGGTLFSTTQLRASFIMLNSDGSQIPEFFIQKALPQRVRKTTVQADGKIYVAGEFRVINGYDRNSLARLNANGTVDTSFVPYFNGSNPQLVHQVVVQPDGKILVAFSYGLVMVRLNPDGSRDTSFNAALNGSTTIYDIALQADGKILIVGDFNISGGPSRFARLNTNGSVDATFNPPTPDSYVLRVLVQPDGKAVIGGQFTQIGASARGRIARFNTDGTLDATFAPAGANGNVYDIDLQADGKIVLGGTFSTLNGNTQTDKIGRLNPDGSVDTSFAQNVNTTVQTVKVQADGKVLIGGLFSYVGNTPRQNLARLNANGSLDLNFNAPANLLVFDVNVQADGKTLVVGDFTRINNVTKLGVARLNNSAPPRKLFDYDGDGKADVSVFRPSENKWYILRSSDFGVTQQIFAVAGDVPVPSDFDGDDKTDMAIYRPSSADWWSLSTINGAQINAHWGEPGAIARPSDFDGDGKSDYIFVSTNFIWYRYGSTAGASNVVFGLAGDKPVTGDFDGDGKSDPAIFRPSTGTWWYRSSINSAQLAVQWGISTDIPAPADYDGDGKTDFAVYRPSSGTWYIINSSNGSFTIMNFGIAEDKPVPADYDGDGKSDIAVFRPSSGVWYLMRSATGFTSLQFGISTDIPTPNVFIP